MSQFILIVSVDEWPIDFIACIHTYAITIASVCLSHTPARHAIVYLVFPCTVYTLCVLVNLVLSAFLDLMHATRVSERVCFRSLVSLPLHSRNMCEWKQ